MKIYFISYGICIILFMMFSILIKDKEKLNHITAIVSFFVVSFLLCLRHPSMGTDLGYYTGLGYLSSFQIIQTFSIDYISSLSSFLNYEWGYIIFNKFISFISSNQQCLLISCGIFSLTPIFFVFYKKSLDVRLSVVIYLALPCFIILFSGLRQGIAIGICFLSFLFIEKKQLLYFILTICIAMLFHRSAIVFFIAYFVYHFQISSKLRFYISIPILILVFVLRNSLFTFLSRIFRENAVIDNNGAINMFIVFSMIYFLCSFIGREDKRINGYLNLFFCACLCQSFSGLYSVASRIGYYFMIFLSLLLPQVLVQFNNKIFSFEIKICLYSCFILSALYFLYTTSWAMSYPYMFFWE